MGYIGNDTLAFNIMACLNIPSLGLFSNSKPLNYNKNLIKLDILKEDDYGKTGIIGKLNVEDVYDKYFEIWKTGIKMMLDVIFVGNAITDVIGSCDENF